LVKDRIANRYEMSRTLLYLTAYARFLSLLLASLFESARFVLAPRSVVERLRDPADRRTRHDECERARDLYLDLYLTCTMHELRLKGEIPILGGIRIVKERVTGNSAKL